jgi:hypothetical protein
MEVAVTMPSTSNILERLRWKVGLGLVIVAAGFAAGAAPSADAPEVARSSWSVAAEPTDVARSSWGFSSQPEAVDVARSSWGFAAEVDAA